MRFSHPVAIAAQSLIIFFQIPHAPAALPARSSCATVKSPSRTGRSTRHSGTPDEQNYLIRKYRAPPYHRRDYETTRRRAGGMQKGMPRGSSAETRLSRHQEVAASGGAGSRLLKWLQGRARTVKIACMNICSDGRMPRK
jgi:hypothetical protein